MKNYVNFCVCACVCVHTLSLWSQTAAPKRWIAYDGNVTEMATPYTLRAAQLRDLYHSLTTPGMTSDERLDILLTLKCTVKVHCTLYGVCVYVLLQASTVHCT